MRTALLLCGTLREFWNHNYAQNVIEKLIIPNNAEVFLFFDRHSTQGNIDIKINENQKLQELYGPYLKAIHLLKGFNPESGYPESGLNKRIDILRSSYQLSPNLKIKVYQDTIPEPPLIQFNDELNVANHYENEYKIKFNAALTKLQPWIENSFTSINDFEWILGRISNYVDSYLKLEYCFRLMEEYEKK